MVGVMMVMMVMMMMVGINNNYHLSLRRDWCHKAEHEHESKQELFHIYWVLPFSEVSLSQ